MRPPKTLAAASLALFAGLLLLGAPEASAGRPLLLKRFLVGHLSPNTGVFVATGGRGADEVFRDSVLLLEFTAPVDFDSLDGRTVRIGIPTGPDRMIPARGTFYPYAERAFDPVSATYVHRRVYRNRVLFDPVGRFDVRTGEVFAPSTTYSVTIPGIDEGALRTVLSTRGTPMVRSFSTTFRTSDEEFSETSCPGMDEVEERRAGD